MLDLMSSVLGKLSKETQAAPLLTAYSIEDMSARADYRTEITLTHRQSINGKVSIITLNRPSKYNALTGEHYRYLASLMHEVDCDEDSIATLWIGTGDFFSAGADVGVAGGQARGPESSDDMDVRRFYTDAFTNGNLNITHVFFNHRRPLFVALNGPVIGMTAALVAYGDFIYATPQTYLLTPFASLGLAPEGGSSVTFPLKMGAGLANRALILSERISCAELAQSGFVTKIFERQGMEDAVFKHIESVMEDKNIDSMRIAKEHIQDGIRARIESANVKEVYGAIDRFSEGIPQLQFLRLASREKKHKL